MDVTVFVDHNLGTAVDKKRDAEDPSLKWNKGALFAETHVYISSYKAVFSSVQFSCSVVSDFATP